jgi:NhaP-type Na+/H+ and K+/H+ antiporter
LTSHLALYLMVFGGLLLVAVLLDDIAARIRLPGILLVLVLGLLIDNNLEAIPGQPPPLLSLDHANQIAQVALVLVLFFGGLTTNWSALRGVLRPAARLATLGAGLTAVLLMAGVLGLELLAGANLAASVPMALFVGAMVCSTDASAVLALLRPLAGQLPQRPLDLLECESAFNDPVAVVLAGLALASGAGDTGASQLVIEVLRQFLLGALLGFLGGSLASQLLSAKLCGGVPSLLAVSSLAVLFLLVGATQLLGGSGLLAAYIAGLVLANSSDCDRDALEQAHAGFAKLAELLLFLCMGLVVQPDQVVDAAGRALLLVLGLQLVRWPMVELLLFRVGFSRPERLMIASAGLRGAVPIALAIQAAASSVTWGRQMPALALGVVLIGLLGQAVALVPLAKRLGLASPDT